MDGALQAAVEFATGRQTGLRGVRLRQPACWAE